MEGECTSSTAGINPPPVAKTHTIRVSTVIDYNSTSGSLKAQTVLRGVVASCYQHYDDVDNKVPQLHTTQSEPLDYTSGIERPQLPH